MTAEGPQPDPAHTMRISAVAGDVIVRCAECRIESWIAPDSRIADISSLADMHARHPDPDTRKGAAVLRLLANRYSHDIAGDNARGSDLAIVYGK